MSELTSETDSTGGESKKKKYMLLITKSSHLYLNESRTAMHDLL
jgi:hypothetical protein